MHLKDLVQGRGIVLFASLYDTVCIDLLCLFPSISNVFDRVFKRINYNRVVDDQNPGVGKRMKKMSIFSLITVLSTCLTSFTDTLVVNHIRQYEVDFFIEFPSKYDVLFYKSITSIDSVVTYMVLKINDGDYKLEYENQLTSDYSNYEGFDVFDKISLASYYFSNQIREDEKSYFIKELLSYDWYGYEYTSTNRYVDLYVLHDIEEDNLYIFYDKHQYPYNNQLAFD
jgi:hypothetical protein